MKPSETIPVGFKLIKQTDPLQYIMTVIVEQSKADIAGLKVGDWLIKIEDNDIRLTDLQDVLRHIYRLFNSVGFINMLIARKKSSNIENPKKSAKTHVLALGDRSNSTENKNPNSSTHKEYSINQSMDPNIDKIRHITLKQASGLYFDSFIPDNHDQIYVHFISNIQTISATYRAGLRNNDRIVTVNSVDVTNTKPEDLRLMISKEQPIQLTVVQDSKYLQSIENFKHNKTQKTSPSTGPTSIDHPQSKESNNILFTDDQGPVYTKHCIIKKDPSYATLGFSLHYEDGFHVIRNVEINFPGYKSGLCNHDIILFVNQRSIQQMAHDDVTILLRSLSNSNQIIDLIIINQLDSQRYKEFQRKNFIDSDTILSKIHRDSTNEIHSKLYLINHSFSK
jgi:hypothetical protein